jgi:hypothetical protein
MKTLAIYCTKEETERQIDRQFSIAKLAIDDRQDALAQAIAEFEAAKTKRRKYRIRKPFVAIANFFGKKKAC